MSEIPSKVLNLIRISDTFFPMGSFTISQGMEQLVSENLFPKEKLGIIINTYLNKIWMSFDFQILSHSLKSAQRKDIEMLVKMDDLCYASKIAEENRTAIVKMGLNLLNAINFERNSLGAAYKKLIRLEKAHGTYPVALAIVSKELKLDEQGGISLIYVNLIEVIASLVRMTAIDYIEAQNMMSETIKAVRLKITGLNDINQSFPLVEIASMRHEVNQSRMFIS
jgi:urease accessory protein